MTASTYDKHSSQPRLGPRFSTSQQSPFRIARVAEHRWTPGQCSPSMQRSTPATGSLGPTTTCPEQRSRFVLHSPACKQTVHRQNNATQNGHCNSRPTCPQCNSRRPSALSAQSLYILIHFTVVSRAARQQSHMEHSPRCFSALWGTRDGRSIGSFVAIGINPW
jgi:hypothetical protein